MAESIRTSCPRIISLTPLCHCSGNTEDVLIPIWSMDFFQTSFVTNQISNTTLKNLLKSLLSWQIKTGAPCRSEFMDTYNSNFFIKKELKSVANYARNNFRHRRKSFLSRVPPNKQITEFCSFILLQFRLIHYSNNSMSYN